MTDAVEIKARELILALYAGVKCMPIMVRLAWHDSGSYSAKDNTGGANATIRFAPESEFEANNGLGIARDFLEPIKAQLPDMTYADLYQLASIVAIEYCGGPVIPFTRGRVDKPQEKCSPDGRLPDGKKGMHHLREIFYRMGLNDKEIVALSGAHCLGSAHKERSDFEGPWTEEPLKFDNTFFQEILKVDPNPNLLRLNSDMAIIKDPKHMKLVKLYAEDQEAFFNDYTLAHKKLSELGM